MEHKFYTVQPIKNKVVLSQVKKTLLEHFRAGRRNYTIFQVGKATLLRVSDVLSLKYSDVYNKNGQVKMRTHIYDQKSNKPNTIYLKPVKQDLKNYRLWLKAQQIESIWLFPSFTDPTKHLTRKQYYKIMAKTGDLLGIDYLGTHTMRKTGAYFVYHQTNFDIGLVMQLLNHSSQQSTLHYLGIDQTTRENILDKIDFD